MKECGFCGKEVTKPFVEIGDVQNEGCSDLVYDKKYYAFTDMYFCDLKCFFSDIVYNLK